MKRNYIVNTQAQRNGDHEVHTDTCAWKPGLMHTQPIGAFETCYRAVREASKYFQQVNGCIHCCEPCHTQ